MIPLFSRVVRLLSLSLCFSSVNSRRPVQALELGNHVFFAPDVALILPFAFALPPWHGAAFHLPLGHCLNTIPNNVEAGDSSYGASESSRRLWRCIAHSGHPSSVWSPAPNDRYGGLAPHEQTFAQC